VLAAERSCVKRADRRTALASALSTRGTDIGDSTQSRRRNTWVVVVTSIAVAIGVGLADRSTPAALATATLPGIPPAMSAELAGPGATPASVAYEPRDSTPELSLHPHHRILGVDASQRFAARGVGREGEYVGDLTQRSSSSIDEP
jgi:hypothetical protein